MLELYGEGLERIVHALDGGGPRCARRSPRDGVVASLLLIHGLYPVPLEERVRGGARSASGPTWSRTAAASSSFGWRDGVAHLRLHGSCDGCPASASTLELAITQALDEAAPDLAGIEVEGVVEASSSKRLLPLAGQAAAGQPTWVELAGVDGLDDRRHRCGRQVGVVRGCWSRTSAARCSPTATPARAAAPPLHRAELDGGCSTCPGCGRRFELPLRRPGRRRRGALQLAPVPLLEDGGAREGRRSRDRRASAIRGAPPGCANRQRAAPRARPDRAPTSAATSAAARSRPTIATCSTLEERRIVCVCETCCALLAGDGPLPADRHRARAGSTTSSSRTSSGRVPDPDRARVLLRSSSDGSRRGRALPEPGRRDRVASSTSRPGTSSSPLNPMLDGARGRRRGADRQPARRPAPATRSCRSTSATGSSGMIRAGWEGISGGDGVDERGRRLLRRAAGGRRCDRGTSLARDGAARPSPSSRCSAPRPSAHAAAPTLIFTLRAADVEQHARSTRSRSPRRSTIDPAAARYDTDDA